MDVLHMFHVTGLSNLVAELNPRFVGIAPKYTNNDHCCFFVGRLWAPAVRGQSLDLSQSVGLTRNSWPMFTKTTLKSIAFPDMVIQNCFKCHRHMYVQTHFRSTMSQHPNLFLYVCILDVRPKNKSMKF